MKTHAHRRFETAARLPALHRAALLCAALLLLPLYVEAAGGAGITITGKVTDQNGQPLIGASVQLIGAGKALVGVACDADGAFAIDWNEAHKDGAAFSKERFLKFSSIGYESQLMTLDSQFFSTDAHANLSVALEAKSSNLDGVTIIVSRNAGASHIISGNRLISLSQQSFAPSNPLEAVRGPAVSRSGSAIGSQIRFAGSSPDYKINGASLGKDPAHYGMFSLLPTEALDRLEFSDQALTASSSSPGIVEMRTDRRFGARRRSQITVSALETVGAARLGNERYFVGAVVRKSVLDKLVKEFSDTTSSTSIPPTNFQDVIVNSGLRISPTIELFLTSITPVIFWQSALARLQLIQMVSMRWNIPAVISSIWNCADFLIHFSGKSPPGRNTVVHSIARIQENQEVRPLWRWTLVTLARDSVLRPK